MQNINMRIKNKSNNEKNKLLEFNNSEYLFEVCKLLPTLLIKTEFGIGKYQFEKIIYKEDKLELLFKLSKDNTSTIQDKIEYHIGNQFIISADQYLYAYRWYAIS
jgi:hypothetical protein